MSVPVRKVHNAVFCDVLTQFWLVITYVAEFFHAFSSLDKAEVTTRRVEKFATMLSSIQ